MDRIILVWITFVLLIGLIGTSLGVKPVLPLTQQPTLAFPDASSAPAPGILGNLAINGAKTLLFISGYNEFFVISYQVYDLIERKPYKVNITQSGSCNSGYLTLINNMFSATNVIFSDNRAILPDNTIINYQNGNLAGTLPFLLISMDLSPYKTGNLMITCFNLSNLNYNPSSFAVNPTYKYNPTKLVDWNDVDADGYAEIFIVRSVLKYTNSPPTNTFISVGMTELFMIDTRTGTIYNSSQFLTSPLISQVYPNVTLDLYEYTIGPSNSVYFFNFNDYNGDGKIDFLVAYMATAWNSSYPLGGNVATASHNNYKVYIQTGTKTFIDSTSEYIIPGKATSKFYGTIYSPVISFDYNEDSLIDMIVSNTINGIYDHFILLRQLSNHTFIDVTSYSFIDILPPCYNGKVAVLPVDFNNDGLLDLYLSFSALSGGYFPGVYLQDETSRFSQISSDFTFPDPHYDIGQLLKAILYDINRDGLIDALYSADVTTKGYTITTLIQGCPFSYYIDNTQINLGCILCQGTVGSDQLSCSACTGLDYYNSTIFSCIACPTDPPSIPENNRLSCRTCPTGQTVVNGFCTSSSSSSDDGNTSALVGGLLGGFGLLGFVVLSCLICLLLCCCSLLVICLVVIIAVVLVVPILLVGAAAGLVVPGGIAGLIGWRKWRKRVKPVQLEEITMVKLIGEGAFGQVYLATCRGDLVAVKKIANTNVKSVEEFRHEVEVLSNLSHPFVIRYIGSIETTDYCYIITSYADGGSLDKVQTSLGYEDKIRIIQEAAEAMIYLHSQGVIH